MLPLYGSAYADRRFVQSRSPRRGSMTAVTSPGARTAEELATLAQRHLWLHFSRMSSFENRELPIITRGEGCYVYDQHGKRYLDGLSALFCVNAGHGRTELAQAAYDQAAELGFYTNWNYAHPKAIELAGQGRRARPGRPQPRLLHERRRRGRGLGAQARAPVPQAHRQPAQDQDDLAHDGLPRHDHGRAVDHRHHGRRASRSSRSCRARCHVPNTNLYRLPEGWSPEDLAEIDPRPDPLRGSRDGRRGLPRAGAELRRLLRRPRGPLPARARDLRRVRRPAGLRRGHLLVGPPRRVLRLPADRLPAGHHHDREGPDLVLRADGRGDRVRPHRRAVHQPEDDVQPRHHLRRAPRLVGGRAAQHRDLRDRGPQRPRARARGRRSARCSSR